MFPFFRNRDLSVASFYIVAHTTRRMRAVVLVACLVTLFTVSAVHAEADTAAVTYARAEFQVRRDLVRV